MTYVAGLLRHGLVKAQAVRELFSELDPGCRQLAEELLAICLARKE